MKHRDQLGPALRDMEKRAADRILALRLDSGRTKTYVSEKTGFSRGFITRLESGSAKPSLRHLAVLATLFGVPVEYFITGKGLTRQLKDPLKEFRAGNGPVRPTFPREVVRA